MFADGVIDLVSTLLTGQPVRNRGQSRGGSTTVRNNPLPYNSMYDYGGGSRRDVGERGRRITPDEIVVNTRDEAESVCRKLEDLMQLYGYVTVDDFTVRLVCPVSTPTGSGAGNPLAVVTRTMSKFPVDI